MPQPMTSDPYDKWLGIAQDAFESAKKLAQELEGLSLRHVSPLLSFNVSSASNVTFENDWKPL